MAAIASHHLLVSGPPRRKVGRRRNRVGGCQGNNPGARRNGRFRGGDLRPGDNFQAIAETEVTLSCYDNLRNRRLSNIERDDAVGDLLRHEGDAHCRITLVVIGRLQVRGRFYDFLQADVRAGVFGKQRSQNVRGKQYALDGVAPDIKVRSDIGGWRIRRGNGFSCRRRQRRSAYPAAKNQQQQNDAAASGHHEKKGMPVGHTHSFGPINRSVRTEACFMVGCWLLSCPNRCADDYNGCRPHGLWAEPLVDKTIKFMVCNNTLSHGSPALCPFVKPASW